MSKDADETADEPWTPERMGKAIEAARARLDQERRAQFAPFGVDEDCMWPAARVFHEHSAMGPAWAPTMTIPEVEAFTLKQDYKRYPGSRQVALPRPAPVTAGLESLIGQRRSERSFSDKPLSLPLLTKLLQLGCGVIDPEEAPPRRATPSGGALYPIEAYPVALAVEGLEPAVYHYAAIDHVLEHVRDAPSSAPLKDFVPPDLHAAQPPLVIGLSAVFPRIQSKYLERGYRFALLEAGHIAQNMVLGATALGLHAVCMGGYWDEPFNDFLGLDPRREAVVYALLIGHA